MHFAAIQNDRNAAAIQNLKPFDRLTPGEQGQVSQIGFSVSLGNVSYDPGRQPEHLFTLNSMDLYSMFQKMGKRIEILDNFLVLQNHAYMVPRPDRWAKWAVSPGFYNSVEAFAKEMASLGDLYMAFHKRPKHQKIDVCDLNVCALPEKPYLIAVERHPHAEYFVIPESLAKQALKCEEVAASLEKEPVAEQFFRRAGAGAELDKALELEKELEEFEERYGLGR